MEWLAPRLRREDAEEIRISTGQEPLDVLRDGLKMSRPCRVFILNGELCGISGTVPSFASGTVWMLGTPGIERYARTFLRHSRAEFARVIEGYRYVQNYVWAENALHIRWIKWIGCEFGNLHTINGQPFLHFTYENKQPCVLQQ